MSGMKCSAAVMEMRALVVLVAVLAALPSAATGARVAEAGRASPVRRVITMLQMMQKKAEEQGEAEDQLFDKFMCYCKTQETELMASIAAAEDRVPQLQASVKELTATEGQLKSELEGFKADREAATTTLAESKELRQKDVEAWNKESAEMKANIGAIEASIKMLEPGEAGEPEKAAFLQVAAPRIQAMMLKMPSYKSYDREALNAFLQQKYTSEDVGEIRGILQQMMEDFSQELASAKAEEQKAEADHNQLVLSKTQELNTATKMIEDFTNRIGETMVALSSTGNDLEKTTAALESDKVLHSKVNKEQEDRQKTHELEREDRGKELMAIADTIKILSDDDAQELLTKAAPSKPTLFMQVRMTSRQRMRRTLAGLRRLAISHPGQPGLRLLAAAATEVGADARVHRASPFSKIFGMIDHMVELLEKEQEDDEEKKDSCEAEKEHTEADKAKLTQTIKTLEAEKDSSGDSKYNAEEEARGLKKSIADLDASTNEAEMHRKTEKEAVIQDLASLNAAIEVLDKARNRLDEYYNPKLYKKPTVEYSSDDERIAVEMGAETPPPTEFVQALAAEGVDDTDADAEQLGLFRQYRKKVMQEAGGVERMLSNIIEDIKLEVKDMEDSEKQSEDDYDELMQASAEKRDETTKALTEKQELISKHEETGETIKKSMTFSQEELQTTMEEMNNIAAECTTLLQSFDMRVKARKDERENLMKAKTILSESAAQS